MWIVSVVTSVIACEVPRHQLKRRDLRVAVVEVHVEGNLGDEFETTPLLRALRAFGVKQIDCYASRWQEGDKDPELWLSPHAIRTLEGVDNYFPPQALMTSFWNESKYDLVVHAPGPAGKWTLNSFASVSDWARSLNMRLIFVGISVFTPPRTFAMTADERRADYARITRAGTRFVMREFESYNMFATAVGADVSETAIVAADLGFSFSSESVVLEYWTAAYRRILHATYGNDVFYIVFARTKDHVILDNDVVLRCMNPEAPLDQAGFAQFVDVRIPPSRILFATSSGIEDAHLIEYYKTIAPLALVLDNVEQLLALIGAMPNARVVSDRYHPGVAALRQNKNLQLMSNEQVSHKGVDYLKMIGLLDMIRHRDDYDYCRMNKDAFDFMFAFFDGVL